MSSTMSSMHFLRNALPSATALSPRPLMAVVTLPRAAVAQQRRMFSQSPSQEPATTTATTATTTTTSSAPEGPSAFHNTGLGIFSATTASPLGATAQSTASPPTNYSPSGQTTSFVPSNDAGTAATSRYFSNQRNHAPYQQNATQYYILHVQASFNNTLVTVTNIQGDAVAMSSGGKAGFKKANRAGYEPAYQATRQVLTKLEAKLGDIAHTFGLHVKLKGFGPGRDAAWKCVLANGWKVVGVEDVTPVAHGGCRPRKARRL